MKIQYVGRINRQFESKHKITYSQFDNPSSLDVFDVNIFSLQDSNMFVCRSSEKHYLDCTNDLRSIREMIVNSKSAINIIAIPQNYEHVTYCNSSSYRTARRIKDELDNLVENILTSIIPSPMTKSYALLYENSESKLLNSKFESSFCFKNVNYGIDTLSKTIGGCKPTTIQKDRTILTTLNLHTSNAEFDDFIKGIGLVIEKTEIPEWLADLNYFDDSSQKSLITENEAKIVQLNEQIVSSKEKIKENLKYKSILITNGSELVKVVFEMLEEMLDYSLADFVDENIEDFLIKKSDITFIGEIKGVTSNVKSEHISQLDTHYHTYTDKLDEEKITENVKAILIINPFRTKPLSEREEVHEKQINLAKRNGSLIITTETFLKLYELFVDGSVSGERINNIFKTNIGLLQVSDFSPSSDCKADNSAYTI